MALWREDLWGHTPPFEPSRSLRNDFSMITKFSFEPSLTTLVRRKDVSVIVKRGAHRLIYSRVTDAGYGLFPSICSFLNFTSETVAHINDRTWCTDSVKKNKKSEHVYQPSKR